MAEAPVFAFFRHPDGSWYRLWLTHTDPKSPRGHPWHVHASYDKSGASAPVAGVRWYEQSYGMANWDFDTQDAALASSRLRLRCYILSQYPGNRLTRVTGRSPPEARPTKWAAADPFPRSPPSPVCRRHRPRSPGRRRRDDSWEGGCIPRPAGES